MPNNNKNAENENFDFSKLPGYLDPGDFDPKEYEEEFRKARNIKLTDERIKNFVLSYAIEKSIGAATSQGSLTCRLSKQSRDDFENDTRNKISIYLFEEFVKITPDFKKEDYETWHNSLCEKLIEKCDSLKPEKDDDFGWTYGNSQKVVNLIIKYLVVISNRAKEINASNETTIIGDVFAGMKGILDIPVDRYIIEASINHNKKDANKKLILPLREDSARRNNERRRPQTKPWSKWNREDYKTYSESLHKVFDCPFDWEGYAWTEVKKAEKNKQSKTNKK